MGRNPGSVCGRAGSFPFEPARHRTSRQTLQKTLSGSRGLGVRDICVDSEDLLVLAGPTMNLDGPVVVYRWRGALESSEEELVFAEDLERLFTVPNGVGVDHAEGITLLSDPKRLLIVYDSPGEERKISDRAIKADVFELS